MDSVIEDINILEIYNLKEKLKVRDPKSSLPELEDMSFLRDLGLIKEDEGVERLTIAGLLFVGKETAINRLLPQAEVIYLHYSADNMEEYDSRLDLKQPIITVIDRLTEKIQNTNKIVNVQVGLFRLEVEDFSEKVFQEALLNALSHRDYLNMGAVYVKHYTDRIVIENPGAFPALWQKEFNTIYNAKKYTSKKNSNPYDLAAAHYRYAILIPETIKENIKVQNIANIPNEIVTQPIGGLSVMYTHNTYPSVAQSLKCPMWAVPGIYSKMRQDNKEYLEENQITVNNGLFNDYKSTLDNYKTFAKDFISRAEVL